MEIRRFNSKGLSVFSDFLDDCRANAAVRFPGEILENERYTELVGGVTDALDLIDVNDRMIAVKQLDEIVGSLSLKNIAKDSGFWSWCSAYLLEKLHKFSRGKLTEQACYIFEPDNHFRRDRHYLAAPWLFYDKYREHSEELKILLNGKLNTPGEFWGQTVTSQNIFNNVNVISALGTLFWDDENDIRKKGISDKSIIRRLSIVLAQFENTYDLHSMTAEEIIDLLPDEFLKFKQ